MNYFDDGKKELCCGCNGCKEICPKNCISMIEDKEGFIYPHINLELCINCNMCKKVCPMIDANDIFNKNLHAYAAFNNNDDIRLNSTSGGIFTELAEYVLKENGVIIGAKYDKDMEVIHGFASSREEYEQLRGSKYVRSNIEGIYCEIREVLKKGTIILFIGTPCEIAGIKKYLRKDYDNLILCDIVCHSNPSPKVFRKYIEHLEHKNDSKIVNIVLRNKEKGWHNPTVKVRFENKSEFSEDYYKNYYIQGFGMGLFSRPCCHECPFTGTDRVGDITIGDFWGIDKFDKTMDDNKGTSLLLLNSLKAERIFDKIKVNLKYKEVNIESAFKYNHKKPSVPDINRDKFFRELDDTEFGILMDRYMRTDKLKTKLGKYIPKPVKEKIKKFILNIKQ